MTDSKQNGNMESPPQLDEDVIKVVVIGEPLCGKTRFIQAFYGRHSPGGFYSHDGVWVFPCEFQTNNEKKRVSIFEIPGNPDFCPQKRIQHYMDANIIIFMYAIDDPSSFQMLSQKWIVEALFSIALHSIPVVFVATKIDLQNDQQVVKRLALKNQSPVTIQQGIGLLEKIPGFSSIFECSSFDVDLVDLAFDSIFTLLRMNEESLDV
ncbi:unnamed protein product [Larinioides sclopetarius]|uniref:Uncharacterized protein n=1 Tax=Larinioides sclopetarius TaxID=280406 RepID=A0AAV2ARI2_9ARAC